MRQYHAVKTRYPHALLLFRLGDFYELFYEDAIVASRELQITLTSRNRERGQPIPMCGVPYHAAENYIVRLIRAGFKVAICEQMELPGPGKKLVRREVTRVITPGTATELQLLDPRENNFLAAVAYAARGQRIGLAWVDISTGEFSATEFAGATTEEKLRDELQLLRPREVLLPRIEGLFADSEAEGPGNRFASRMELREGAITRLEDWIFGAEYGERTLTEQFGVAGLEGFGLADHPEAATAAGAIVHYLRETSAKATSGTVNEALQHLDRVRYYEQLEVLALDSVSVRNLE
ncbi:MAG: DNA mismatch repair protein MutS, partial [Bryobacteraceae bacterium]